MEHKSGCVIMLAFVVLFSLGMIAAELDPLLAGLAAVSGLIVALTSWFLGWGFGARHGRAAEERAQATQADAKAERDRAVEDQRIASVAREDARNQENAFKAKCMAEETALIQRTKDLPLLLRLQAAGTFGKYPGESWQAFEDRRDATLQKRGEDWESGRRYGQRLLLVVEAQGGLCGDPAKDANGKGCGCYLYALPPGAVHLDHVVPQAKGGSDELDNIQALCFSCNTRAGARAD